METRESFAESNEGRKAEVNNSNEEINLLSNLNEYKFFSSKFLRQLLKQRIGNNQNIELNSERIFGCILFADISGFTQLSSRLNAEELKKHINLLLGVIHSNYGDVIKFCGDAVMILWPVPIDASHDMKAASVLLASLCGLQLLEECGDYKKYDSKSGSAIELSLHCGIACGDLHCMILGNGHRSEFIATGDTLSDMGLVEGAAKTGELCIASSAYEYVRNSLETLPVIAANDPPVYKLTGKISGSFLQCSGGTKASPSNLDINLVSTEALAEGSLAVSSTDGDAPAFKQRKSDIATVGDDLWTFFSKTTASGSKGNTSDHNRDNSLQSADDVSRDDSEHEPRGPSNSTSTNRRRRGSISLLLAGLSPTRNSQEALAPCSTPTGAAGSPSSFSSTTSTKARHRMSTSLFRSSIEQSLDNRNSEKTVTDRQQLPSLHASSTDDAAAPGGSRIEDKLQQQQQVRNSRIRRSYGTRYLKHKLKISSDPGVLALTKLIVHGQQAVNATVDGGVVSKDSKKKQMIQLSTALRKFIHETALSAIDTHTSALLSEMRVITTLFIEIEGLQEDFAVGNIARPHKTFVIILSVMQKFGGSLRQFVVDDKGCVCIVCFGVFGSSKENNSRQAIEFAQLLQASLPSVGVSTSIGITTGKVYCGIVGAGHRCEFAVMGSSVNLAARLMCACKKVGARVLVDNVVYQNAIDYFSFQQYDKITAKGYSQPVAVFQPMGKRKTTFLAPIDSVGTASLGNATVDSKPNGGGSSSCASEEFPSRIVSNEGDKCRLLLERDTELEKVMSSLVTSEDEGSCSTRTATKSRSVLVFGASGIGLTSFLSLVEEAALVKGSADLHVVSVQCSTHMEYSSYSICGKILSKLMGVDETARIEEGGLADGISGQSVMRHTLRRENSIGAALMVRPHRLSAGVAHRRSSCKTLESTALAAIIEQPFENVEGHRNSNASNLGEQRSSNASKAQVQQPRMQHTVTEQRILRWIKDHLEPTVTLGQSFLYCTGKSMAEYFSHVGTHDALDAETVNGLNSVALRDALAILNDILKTNFVPSPTSLDQLLSSTTSDVVMDLFVDVMVQSLLSLALGDFGTTIASAATKGSALILIDDVHLCDIESLNIVTKLAAKLHRSSASVESGGFVLTCNENENRLGILESHTKRSVHQSKLSLAASIRRGISHRSLQLNLQLAALTDISMSIALPRLQSTTVKLIVKDYLGYRQWAWLMNNYKKPLVLPRLRTFLWPTSRVLQLSDDDL